jgi:hypothetical protein
MISALIEYVTESTMLIQWNTSTAQVAPGEVFKGRAVRQEMLFFEKVEGMLLKVRINQI